MDIYLKTTEDTESTENVMYGNLFNKTSVLSVSFVVKEQCFPYAAII